MNTIKGTAFVFPDNVDTDQIYPGRFVELTEVADVAKHAMAGIDETFVERFKTGDIIIGGKNFGCGSSREHAVITLKGVGVGAILAESFARIFFRNGINLGVPLLTCPGISKLALAGKTVEVDMKTGAIKADGIVVAQAEPFSDYVAGILKAGGIKPLIQKELAQQG